MAITYKTSRNKPVPLKHFSELRMYAPSMGEIKNPHKHESANLKGTVLTSYKNISESGNTGETDSGKKR